MTFKEYILHQLREMRRELLTAVKDVPTKDLFAFEPCNHWPIGWIAEHCTEVADGWLYTPVQDERMYDYEPQVESWTDREPQPGDTYPEPSAIAGRWAGMCDWIISFVEEAGDDDLQKPWGREPYINSLLRVINHTNSHLRSLWCILGERRVDHKWAEQQTPFA
jgi:hypothetical protein